MSSPLNPDNLGNPASHEPPPSVTTDSTVRTGAGTPVSARVMVTNRAFEPRVMAITAMGADASWLPTPSRSRVLQPGETILAELRLSPAVGTLPARYPIALAVQALDPITEQARSPTALQELQLIVDAPGQIGIELAPLDASAVFGKKIGITLHNTGESAAQVRLATQATPSTPVRLDETEVHLRAGETRKVRGRVRVRRARLVGHRSRHTYSVSAHSAGAPRHVEASLTARAMLGPTGAKITALAAVVAVWVALAIIFIPKLADTIKGDHDVTARSAQSTGATAGPGTSSGATGGSGNAGSPGGSGGGPGGNGGGSGGQGHGGAAAAEASAIQLNGTVTGTHPGGVDVTIKQTTLQAEDAIDATPVGIAPQSLQTVTKISSAGLLTPTSADQPSSRSVLTDPDGAWSFAAVDKPGYYLLTFAKPGYQTVRYIVNSMSAGAAKPLKVALVPGEGKLSGMIRGPSGPVGGARITITDGTNTITTSSISRGHVGAWSVDGLSTPSTYLVTASKSGLGTQSGLVSLGAGESATVSLRLKRGVGSLIGVVSGSDGPLGGASVTATNGKITRTATSITRGAVGQYVLPDLPEPGTYTVTVSADGYQPQTQRVRLRAGQSNARIDANLTSATATINGTVRSGGKPVAGAGLTLRSTENTYKLTSTNRGGFSFDGVAAGTYVLSAQYFGLVTGYVTITAVPGQTRFTAVDLKPAPPTISHSSVTGFVADGGNPSNTLCAMDGTDCSVSFRLCKAQAGDGGLCAPSAALVLSADGKAFSSAPTIAPAGSGPTAYTLSAPKDVGLAPGLYHLTISVSDHNHLVSYLPATVNVQIPLNGVAHAPQVSLYTASTISGVVRSTYDWSANGTEISCVWALPVDSSFTPTGCQPRYDPPDTSPCASSGTPSPTVGAIDPQGGAYSIAGLCNGSYRMRIVTTNPDFAPAPTSASQFVTVLNGSPGYFNGQIFRMGRIQFFLTYPSAGDASPIALSTTTLADGSTCTPVGSAGTPIDLGGLRTDGGGSILIKGQTPGTYHCTLKARTPGPDERTVSATTPADVTINWDTTTAVHLVLAAPIEVFIGRVTTSWSGSEQPVGDTRVTVSGVVDYDSNRSPITDNVTVTTDANGCFAVAPTRGTTHPAAPTSGPCAGDTTIPTSYLPLKAPRASFEITTRDGYQALHESGVDVSVDPNTSVIGLNIDPNPVSFKATVTVPTVPDDGTGEPAVDLTTVKVSVIDSASGSGDITAKINIDSTGATGTINWSDHSYSGGEIVPGGYTLRFSGPDLPTWNYRFVCAPGGECQKSFALHAFGSLELSGVPQGAIVTLYNNDTRIGDPKTAPGGPVTFDNLLPTTDYATDPDQPVDGNSWAEYDQPSYRVQVHAAGKLFGKTGETDSPVSITCDGAATISISEAAAAACTISLKPDGSITGTLTGITGKYDDDPGSDSGTDADTDPGTDPDGGSDSDQTHKLNDVEVTAELCQDPVTLPATNCTTSGANAQSFSDRTNDAGEYTITGTNKTQGLDPGYWLVTTHAVGYGAPDGSGAARHKVVHITADSLTQTADFDLYVALIDTFTVSVKDDSGNVLTDKTVTSVTMRAGGTGTELTATYKKKNKEFEFHDVIPGTYDIKVTGTQFSPTTDHDVPVNPSNLSYDLSVGLHSNTVTGTVVGDQGSTGVAGLKGVIVQIGTVDKDDNFTLARGVDGDKLTMKTSTSELTPGAFRFTAVPDSPPGGWTVQLSRAGYKLTQKTLTVDPLHQQWNLKYSMDRITHDVSITVTSKSSADDLDGVAAKLVSVAGSADSPAYTPQKLTITLGDPTSSFTASLADAPYGCWKLVPDLPPNHYGTLSMTSTPDSDDYLDCPEGSITVPSTGKDEVDAAYDLDEGALKLSLSASASVVADDGTRDSVPAMTVSVSNDSGSVYTNTDFPTSDNVIVWLPTSQTYSASVQPADDKKWGTAWPTSAKSTKSDLELTTDDTTPAPLAISERPVLHLKVQPPGSAKKASVTVAPGSGQSSSVPDDYQDAFDASGEVDLYLPAGNWKITATVGTAPNEQAAYATAKVATDTAVTRTLAPTWASLAVVVDGLADDESADVVLSCTGDGQTQPQDCENGVDPDPDSGTGDTSTFTGLAAGSWSIHVTTSAGKEVTKPVTLVAGKAGDNGKQGAVHVTPELASVTVTVKDVRGKKGKTIADATVTFVAGTDQSLPAPDDSSGPTQSDGTFTVDDLPTGSWTVNVSYTDADKKTSTGSSGEISLHGGSNNGIKVYLDD